MSDEAVPVSGTPQNSNNDDTPLKQMRLVSTILIVSLFLLILCKSFLLESFWLDECITGWIINSSLEQVFERTIAFQGQSPLYYSLLWAWQSSVGTSEIVLRSFSLFFLVVASVQIYFITARTVNREAARYAVPLFFSLSPVLVALSARPYAFALCCALGALQLLFLYIDTKKVAVLLSYGVAVTVTFYAHYLFFSSLIIHGAAIYYFAPRQERFKIFRNVIIALLCTTPLLFPGFEHLISLFERREQIAFLKVPGNRQIIEQLLPPGVCVAAVIATSLALIAGKGIAWRANERCVYAFYIIWFFALPLVVLVSALVGSTNLFHPRYLLWCSVGAAPLIGSLIAGITPAYLRERTFCIMLITLIFAESQRHWMVEDWRGAAAIVAKEPETPVYLATGLAESNLPSLRKDLYWEEYLRAPLLYYHVPNPSELIPTSGTLEEVVQSRYFVIAPRKTYGEMVGTVEKAGKKLERITAPEDKAVQIIVGKIQ